MQHKSRCNVLMSWLYYFLIAIIVLGISGCVKLSIETDKNDVSPYEQVTLTAICDPADTGGYSFLWSVVSAPIGSEHYAIPWKMLDSKTTVQTFTPDIPGTYIIDCKVITGDIQGMNIATITINCVGTVCEYTVDPQLLEFGYIQNDKSLSITNESSLPIQLEIDRSKTAAWVTEISNEGEVAVEGTSEVSVQISREGLEPGDYETSFDIVVSNIAGEGSVQCGFETINITMAVGPARIVFCVDTSGSMADNDPDDKRVVAVNDTINKFYDNERVSFGIIDFDTTAQKLVDFTRNTTDLTSAAGSLNNDEGWTNYLGDASNTPGALDVVDSMITDLSYYYVVIFLSDGEPTKGNQVPDDIVNKVTEIATPTNVKLYTIYLNGHPLDSAIELLDGMAAAGGTTEALVVDDADYLSFINLDF